MLDQYFSIPPAEFSISYLCPSGLHLWQKCMGIRIHRFSKITAKASRLMQFNQCAKKLPMLLYLFRSGKRRGRRRIFRFGIDVHECAGLNQLLHGVPRRALRLNAIVGNSDSKGVSPLPWP